MDPPSTFPKARRKKAVRRLSHLVGGADTQELLPLDEVTRRLGLFQQSYVGIRQIPIDRIVGTVDRARDFDRELLPRRPGVGRKWRGVERAFPEGGFPPIEVYQVGGSYFVIDGHHRVAVAKQRGATRIEAEVIRLVTRMPLPPDADVPLLIHLEQQRRFLEESGLAAARPDAHIDCSRPAGYLELLDRVRVHGFHLMRERRGPVPMEEIAGDWYDWLYRPVVDAFRAEGFHDLFPDALEGDLFLWAQERLREVLAERGGASIEEVVHDASAEARRRFRARIRRAVRRLRPAEAEASGSREPGDGSSP
jgi:hypothetical protein